MATFEDEEFTGFVDLLDQAALNPERWNDVIQKLSGTFDSATCSMLRFDPASQTAPAELRAGATDDWWKAYDEYYCMRNPYPVQAYLKSKPGTLLYAPAVVPDSQTASTDFVADFLNPAGMGTAHFGCSLWQDESSMVLLVLLPPEKIVRRMPEKFAQRFERLIPAMRRTLDINRTLLAHARHAESVGAALDAIPVPAFVVNRQRKLLLTNQRGEALLSGPEQPLRVERSMRLSATVAAADDRLFGQVDAAFRLKQFANLAPQRLTCRRTGRAFVATIMPLSRQSHDQHEIERILGVQVREPAVMLLVTPVTHQMIVPPEQIRDALGLTIAEARLVSALVEGLTLAEYAHRAGVTRNTVRNQLASVFRKTDTNRQATLIATVVSALYPLLAGVGR